MLVAVQLLSEDVFISPSVLKGVCPVGGALSGWTVCRGAVSDEGLFSTYDTLAAKVSLCQAFGQFMTLGAGVVSSCFLCLYSALDPHPRDRAVCVTCG